MSSPLPPDPQAAQQHQAAQIGLSVALAAALAQLWPSLDLADLRNALPRFTAAVTLQVQRHAQAAATLAATHYRAQRRAAGVMGGFTPRPADPPPAEQVAQMVSWATQPLWASVVAEAPNAPPEVPSARPASKPAPASAPKPAPHPAPAPTEEPRPTGPSAEDLVTQAQDRLEAGSERLVGEASAATIIENTARDPKAKGYARHPEPNACSFCLMLASRGGVYKASRSGGRGDSFAASNAKFKGDLKDPSTIKVHDSCHCQPEPFWGRYEPSPEADAAERLWVESTHGLSGKAAQRAFRQAVEGRTAPTK